MTCDEARRLAPEAALELLDGALRAEVLDHVDGCAPCRTELAALAATADLLLVAVPPVEPPPGFESRTLARLARAGGAPATRRRWLVPAVAAAVAALAGLGVGLAVGDDDRPGEVLVAPLVGAEGASVGQVLVTDEPDRMVCVLDGAPEGVRYEVAVTAGGRDVDLGSVTSTGPGEPWAIDLPVDGADVRRVVIRDADGSVRATATVSG